MSNGVVIDEWVTDRLRSIFGHEKYGRLGMPTMEDDDVYFTVSTVDRPITDDEFMRIAIRLDVPAGRIRFEALMDGTVRFVVNVAPVTKPETPSAMEAQKK